MHFTPSGAPIIFYFMRCGDENGRALIHTQEEEEDVSEMREIQTDFKSFFKYHKLYRTPKM